MKNRLEHGMATAEYTVGTLGAVIVATVLYKFGMLDSGNPWFDNIKEILERALGWGTLLDSIPGWRFVR